MNVASNLSDTAERLSEMARANRLSMGELQRECPWLCRQILQDAKTNGLLNSWGQSSNYDELASAEIVEPGVLNLIGELAGIAMQGQIVHAGLQHTYGYLLSTIVTPYGYKRDRWLTSYLERGFGMPADVLSPEPATGTLLCNATLFAGLVALRGDEAAIQSLRKVTKEAAPAIHKVEFDRAEQTRIVESVSVRDSGGRFRSVRIQTDLVPFLQPVEGCVDDCLLVYSIKDSRQASAQLITLFTVAPATVAELTEKDRFGPSMEIRTRFNALVAGVSGKLLTGRRTLTRLGASE